MARPDTRRKGTSKRNFGMSDKYIIRNCPSFYRDFCGADDTDDYFCCDETNCILKQIVEKCKLFQNNYLVNDGVQLLTTNILNSLDIEECK